MISHKQEFNESLIYPFPTKTTGYEYAYITKDGKALWCDGTFHVGGLLFDKNIIENSTTSEESKLLDLKSKDRIRKGRFESINDLKDAFNLYLKRSEIEKGNKGCRILKKEEVLSDKKDSIEIVAYFNFEVSIVDGLSEDEAIKFIKFFNSLKGTSFSSGGEVDEVLKEHNLEKFSHENVWGINSFDFSYDIFEHLELFIYEGGRKFKAELLNV